MAEGKPASFHNPVKIRFGRGSLSSLAQAAAGRRCVLLASPGAEKRGVLERVRALLGKGLAAAYIEIAPNPTVQACERAARAVQGTRPGLIVAVGGGSVLDTAKAVAAQSFAGAEDGWLSRHLRNSAEFPGGFSPTPILAVPTTAGTGSEVTMWATVWDEKTGKKYSLSNPALYPEAALVDPEVTATASASVTTAAALDALSHAMEAVWNRNANPVSDALAMRAITMIPGLLTGALAAPEDLDIREGLSAAALLAGLASSNTRTAIAHSVSYPLTSERGLAHGFACSLALPEVLIEVGARYPGRAALITASLGRASAAEAAAGIYALFKTAGVAREIARRVADEGALSGLKGSLITPGRADNCLVSFDEDSARALLARAYRSLL